MPAKVSRSQASMKGALKMMGGDLTGNFRWSRIIRKRAESKYELFCTGQREALFLSFWFVPGLAYGVEASAAVFWVEN